MDRRTFLRTIAATGAGVAAGCNYRSAEKLLPYTEQPEEITPGTSVYYATTCMECPAGCGLLARTREGRVLKLEGNPQHPLSQGSLCARGQAAVQGLYNPDRITKPLARDDSGALVEVSWDEAMKRLTAMAATPQGECAWLTGVIPDSDYDLVDLWSAARGIRKPVSLQLFPEAPIASAANLLFGKNIVPEFHFEAASLIVSINADFLETWGNPVAQIKGFTKMHTFSENGGGGRAIYIGSRQGNTAACCDRFVPLAPGLESAAMRVLADAVLKRLESVDSSEFTKGEYLLREFPLDKAEKAVGESLEALRDVGRLIAQAEAPLVIASGLGEDAELAHMLTLMITYLAGGAGKTVTYPIPGRPPRGNPVSDARGLVNDFAAGMVGTLLVHGANPAFLLPGASDLLAKGKQLIYFGTQMDETASLAHLVLPIHHPLESWGDHEAADGIVGILQPVMRPIFGSHAFSDIILECAQALNTPMSWSDGRAYAESRMLAHLGDAAAASPTMALRDLKKRGGIWGATRSEPVNLSSIANLPRTREFPSGMVAHFFPHPYWYDGRGADKPWLQEVPETSTSAVWNTWAEIHPQTAKALGVDRGDAVTLAVESNSITIPVLLTEQVMPGIIAAPIGQGHESMGRYAMGRGANPLNIVAPTWEGGGLTMSGMPVKVTAVKGGGRIITMAGSQDQGEREIAQAITVPKDAQPEHEEHHLDISKTFYPKKEYDLYNWGMTIDLDSCTGCGACAVACYAENNLGIVGEERMEQGREMSWIRIEKYAEGDDVRMMPNLCQHCEDAPCEPVCPVQAAYHNDEGLNVQVYNRCVGTRYCSNNCPYKVRRFNWFDYEYPAPLHLQLNPDISVRERGVMEKCTFCVHRIKAAKADAKDQGRMVADGEVTPACAQTCPANAITFGNLKDENSRVNRIAADKRAYHLLAELGTRSSITYLKKVIRKDF